jgi:hypothetical protein
MHPGIVVTCKVSSRFVGHLGHKKTM